MQTRLKRCIFFSSLGKKFKAICSLSLARKLVAVAVAAMLEKYLKRTKVWRGKGKSQLLLSFVKPYNPVISSTISGWIKNVLREAGIDTKIFKGHSTRSASTSKAGMAGLSVTNILESGSCTNVSTWQRFHNRQVESSAEKCQNKVLR